MNEDIAELAEALLEALVEARAVAEKIGRGAGGREMSLTITKIQEAQHWLTATATVTARLSNESVSSDG